MDRSFRFCILLTLGVLIPVVFIMVPLYLRHHVFASAHMAVSSTDSRHIDQRISTIWCESQTIAMNTSFDAFVLSSKPTFENSTRTYWTTKHFNLRSEEREYWGFYLPKGSVLTLSMCAKYEGAKLHLFKGKRNMKKCTKREEESYEDEGEMSDEDDDYLTDDDMYDSDSEEEGSSVSSSEEDFQKECLGALFNQTLASTKACEAGESWQPKDMVTYSISSSDYYYVLFSSLNNLFVNRIVAKIMLKKPVYNVSKAIRACINSTECNLPLTFGSSENVVVVMPDHDEWVADVGYLACEPRTMLYYPFYLGVPISILFFAFRGSK